MKTHEHFLHQHQNAGYDFKNDKNSRKNQHKKFPVNLHSQYYVREFYHLLHKTLIIIYKHIIYLSLFKFFYEHCPRTHTQFTTFYPCKQNNNSHTPWSLLLLLLCTYFDRSVYLFLFHWQFYQTHLFITSPPYVNLYPFCFLLFFMYHT